MADILETIAAATLMRVREARERIPLDKLMPVALEAPAGPDFRAALSKPHLSFICEIKKASPSKGLISPDFPYMQLAETYAAGGADAISCLTEPQWFLGSDDIFRDIRAVVPLPMLRKDFIVDSYQIWESKALGASAVLLICALLDDPELHMYLELTRDLGLAALVEAHDENEVRRAVAAGAEIIGVNNRNLKDFSVDFGNAGRLRSLIPDGVLYVAESGVSSPEDVRMLAESGVDAVLMGEVLMRAADPRRLLRKMREAADGN